MKVEFNVLDRLGRIVSRDDATANLTDDEFIVIPWSLNLHNIYAWVQATEIHDEVADVHHPATYVSIYFGNLYYSPTKEFRAKDEIMPDWLASAVQESHHLRTTCGVHCTLAYLPEMSCNDRRILRQRLNRRIGEFRDAWLRSERALRTCMVSSLRVRSWYLRPEDAYDFGRVVKADCAEGSRCLARCIEQGRLALPQVGLYVTIKTPQELEARVQRDEDQRKWGEALLRLALVQRDRMHTAHFQKGWLPFRYRRVLGLTRIDKVDGAGIRLLLGLCLLIIKYDAGGYHMTGFNKKLHCITDLDKMHVTPQPKDAPAIYVSTDEIEIPEQDDWGSACEPTLVPEGRLRKES